MDLVRTIEEFANASGTTGPLRFRIEAPEGVKTPRAPDGQPFVVIGSDPQADLVLDHPDVSRRHAYLQVVDGRVFVVDLESRLGLRIDGLAARSGWVRRAIEIGPYRVEVELEDSGAEDPERSMPSGPLEVRSSGQGGLPELVLESRGAEPWRMKAMMAFIGSASGCRVRLSDDSVSRYHAALVRTRSGVWVVDLIGRGGISVNEAPVRVARVEHGDKLRVGRFSLKLRCGDNLPALLAPAAVQTLQKAPWLTPPALPAMPEVEGNDPHMQVLIQQFGQMQQQMFDQFQQALMMMFQVFRTMHQDQVDLVKAELERVRSLNQELQDLQIQAAKAQTKSPSPAPPSSSERSAPRPAPTSPPSPAPSKPDVHLMLHRRIAAIQEERQGRWQKIMNLVTGGASA